MRRELISGLVAGAAGTVALNVVTYLDMVLRGRPASDLPADAARALAGRVGVDLDGDDEASGNRASGIGALLGFVTGLAVGAAYGVVRSRVRRVPVGAAGVGLGLAAMAGSDTPATALGLTRPTEWGASGWAADIVPHLAYGMVTALTYDTVAGRDGVAGRGR